MMVVSELGVLTVLPPTAVITSPAEKPAVAAGVPQSSPRISAPELTGATLAGTPAFRSLAMQLVAAGGTPAPLPLSSLCISSCRWRAGLAVVLALSLGTSTPRKPVVPILMVALPWPAMMVLAIDSALLIGMAKPTLCWLPPRLPVAAAVFMPITFPAVLDSGPPEGPGRRFG